MGLEIYTVGLKISETRNSYCTIDALDNLIKTKDIKIVIDTRSFTYFTTYSENSKFHPVNLNRHLRDKEIEYFNLGESIRYFRLLILTDPRGKTPKELWEELFTGFSERVNSSGKKYGNVCIIFPHLYCFVKNRTAVTLRGNYSRFMHNLKKDQNLFHYLPFKSGQTIFSNTELWENAYGELASIRQDIEWKKRPYEPEIEDYDNQFSPTDQDLEDMQRGAYDGNPNNEWNTD